MFLFNQRLLPTRTRCHRVLNDSPFGAGWKELCVRCSSIVLQHSCCSSSNEDLIRGSFGPVGNLQLSFTLLAAYLYINWKARNNLRTPCQE
ncbi:Uncharacterized protein APZ42_009383, partial [Daphnia magna]